ncbi:LRR receptor-like serine/threonine-protein kinase ERECTA [Vitis vinifera]|uniref:LRR receptor-like serine/threonine-protein kinase ERECTA n=1 Tax=Vitis vinifera TaxID=29760 RepID=A0A438F4P0_VITVI|nr:LRR receptor-like serine/threonine-protein kinase ERECTA [Vitis vinifera]
MLKQRTWVAVAAVVVGFQLLGMCNLFALAMLDPLDFLALQSIRKGLEDLPGSNFFASWDFTSDPCNFAGVYCDSDKVLALNLGDPRAGSPGLTGHLDPAIGKLSALVEFTVVPGRIIGSLPQTLSQLKNLRYNQLTGGIPRSIGTLPALSNVILCHNRLSGTVPPLLSQTLTRLDLKHNDLSGSISPSSLPPSLQYLSLSWNRLSGTVDRALTRMNRLNYLDLSMNRFSGCIPGRVFTFPITNLQLQRNSFTGPVQPPSQVTITTVDLSFNRLSGQISPLFSTVQNLYLNNNRFIGHVPATLVDRLLAANIQILYLQHNYLTGIEINPTASIPLSSSLCLQYNCMVPPYRRLAHSRLGSRRRGQLHSVLSGRGKDGKSHNASRALQEYWRKKIGKEEGAQIMGSTFSGFSFARVCGG